MDSQEEILGNFRVGRTYISLGALGSAYSIIGWLSTFHRLLSEILKFKGIRCELYFSTRRQCDPYLQAPCMGLDEQGTHIDPTIILPVTVHFRVLQDIKRQGLRLLGERLSLNSS